MTSPCSDYVYACGVLLQDFTSPFNSMQLILSRQWDGEMVQYGLPPFLGLVCARFYPPCLLWKCTFMMRVSCHYLTTGGFWSNLKIFFTCETNSNSFIPCSNSSAGVCHIVQIVGEPGFGGSHTPSMVGAVQNWRKNAPENAQRVWEALINANRAVEAGFLHIFQMAKMHKDAYDYVLTLCGTLPAEKVPTLTNVHSAYSYSNRMDLLMNQSISFSGMSNSRQVQ